MAESFSGVLIESNGRLDCLRKVFNSLPDKIIIFSYKEMLGRLRKTKKIYISSEKVTMLEVKRKAKVLKV